MGGRGGGGGEGGGGRIIFTRIAWREPLSCIKFASGVCYFVCVSTFVGALADGAVVLAASVNKPGKRVHVGLAAIAPDWSTRTVVNQVKSVLIKGTKIMIIV